MQPGAGSNLAHPDSGQDRRLRGPHTAEHRIRRYPGPEILSRDVIWEIRVDDHKIQIIGHKASPAAVIAGQRIAARR